MAKVYQLPTQVPGTVDVFPSQKYAIFGDDLATVTTAGYLNEASLDTTPISQNDIISAFYSYNTNTGAGSYGLFTVSISNLGVITLSSWANPGEVTLPVVSGNFASFSGTNGVIADMDYLPSDATKTNVVMASAATTLNSFAVFADVAGTVKDLVKANGTESANAVTASGQSGVITTSALTTAAAGSYAITWTNTLIAAGSAIQLTLMGGTNTVKSIQFQAVPGAGSATLTIYNIDAADALDGTIILAYTII